MDFSSLFGLLKDYTKPTVAGAIVVAAFNAILVGFVNYETGLELKEAALVGAGVGIGYAVINKYAFRKLFGDRRDLARAEKKHRQIEQAVLNGYLTVRQATLLHAQVEKSLILDLPDGEDFTDGPFYAPENTDDLKEGYSRPDDASQTGAPT